MTGLGEAHRRADGVAVVVEVRTVNNRYFKLALKCGEGYGLLEHEIENVVRQQIRRGTVQVSLRVDRLRGGEDFRLNPDVLLSYHQQLSELHRQYNLPADVPFASLLSLPGVVVENPTTPAMAEEEWPLVRETLEEALANLAQMRSEEGRAMAVRPEGQLPDGGQRARRHCRSGRRTWRKAIGPAWPSGCSPFWPNTQSRSLPAT